MAMTTYAANCHCGRVQFTATLPDITTNAVVRCNCSICSKNGYLLVYPKAKDVKFTAGEGRLGEYRFGNKKKPHKFCMLCGTSILIDFSSSDFEAEKEYTAVNIRTFQGIEDLMDKLKFRDVDGKNKLQPPYSIPRVQ
ncbi:Glutathione-dependent formaldehyde-activating [Lasiodiplodia theobromae]|uniref:Centromere protein V n=2 Tax=Lasiodiplodia TaxID=66739 RepID=A0A5N5DDD1_9PEZI|nr:Aldehyde-activating protein [Lasiodiplodia theobromae]KAB2575863.1 Centromere protein V [Lasiodiplodia theobromae]KAF4546481.1 Aldehyde-activating protein [Lasiodiplodia theobromae]KAF9631891.1 Glutathione-dependent formaldehyde-activating [Lasiodiplodia theobromae]KAK0662642.1 Centromere protein V [Lasiodiplodia hormozganensis]